MGNYLNPSTKGFQESLNSKIYVDKTMLTAQTNSLVNTKQKYICVSRPRRFGKTMAVDMLSAYCCCEKNTSEMFDALKIAAPLLPYYMVANGAHLSDEYELFSYEYALLRQEELYYELNNEELLSKKPEGIVFARCADGDTVLLCRDNSVIRWSHEEPIEVDKWDSLAQFIFEAINSW